MYPGGTRFDPLTRGYSHLSNYWCDLLDRVSYGGDINHARPFAILATIVLPMSLVPLWLQVSVLFRNASASMWIVRVAGPAAMVCAALIFTPMHNFVINLASVLGLTVFLVTTLSLDRSRYRALVVVAVVALSLAILNWGMWQTGTFLEAMPMVQKMAYALFFLWIIGTSRAISYSLAKAALHPSRPI